MNDKIVFYYIRFKYSDGSENGFSEMLVNKTFDEIKNSMYELCNAENAIITEMIIKKHGYIEKEFEQYVSAFAFNLYFQSQKSKQ